MRALVFSLIFLLTSAPLAALPQLQPIAAPTLDGMEPAVRQQLDQALDDLRLEVEAAGSSPESPNLRRQLAESYGGLGQIYLAYDLTTPARVALDNARRLDPEDFRWLYLLASLEQNEAELATAAQHFEDALALPPPPAELALAARIRLGNVYLDAQRLEDARLAFQQAIELDGEAAAAHAGLGRAAARQERPQDAVGHFRRALELQPEASAVRYPLAIALRELGQRDAARHELTQRGDVQASFRDPLAEAVLELATGSGVHLMFGNRAVRNGRLEVAEQRFRRALEVNPRSAEAHQSLAAVLEGRGERQQAIEHYSSALALAPDNPSLHYNLGTILVDQGHDEQAIRHFQAALRLAPDYLNARFNLAAVLARGGHYAEAAPLYDSLLASEGQDDATRFYAAHTFQNLGQHDRANELLKELVEEDGNRPRARLAWARGLLATGRVDDAREQLGAVLDLPEVQTPQRQNAHLELARLGAREARWESALEHFDAVLASNGEHAEALFGRAMALLLAQRYNDAAVHLETAVQRRPADLDLLHLQIRFLATCPVRQLRDGPSALDMAFDLIQQRQRLDIAQTLAMALAEQGRFAEAVGWQQRVLSRARQGGDSALLATLEADLEAYRAERPVLAPWLRQAVHPKTGWPPSTP